MWSRTCGATVNERGNWSQIPESGSAALLRGNARSLGTIAYHFGHPLVTHQALPINGNLGTQIRGTRVLSRQRTDLQCHRAT